MTTTYAAAAPAASIRTLVTVRAFADVTSDQLRDPPPDPPRFDPLPDEADAPLMPLDALLIPLVASRT